MVKQSHSLTEGSIWKSILLFALPVFFSNVLQQLYNTFDAWCVGNYIGDDALAAVSSSGSLIFLMVGFFHGTAMGAGVVIARAYGAKDYDAMRKSIHTAIAFGLVAGAALSVVGVVLTPTILRWMGTPAEVLPQSIEYFRYYSCGAIFSVVYNMFVGILHAVGDSRHPLYYLILSSFINVALDLLFIAVFHWGVASAAVATILSQAVSALLCLRQLMRVDGPYRVDLRKLGFHMPTLKNVFRFGLPSGIQHSVISLANVVVQANINAFGSNAMAGCGSYSRIEGFAFLPVTCFAMSLSTFVGQNLGAKQYDRVKKGSRFGIVCCILLSEFVGILIYLFAPYLVALFNNEPEVVHFGTMHAHTVALFYCLMALSHSVAGVLRGAGKASVPMTIMLICWCIIRVIYITVTVRLIPDIRVVFFAYPLTWTLSTIAFLVYYFKADWIHHFDRLDRKAS